MIELIIAGAFLGISYLIGNKIESNHIKDIIKREKKYMHLPYRSTGLKETFENQDGFLVYGSVVVTHDAFKNFVMGLINIVGGRVTVYESLLERARREALLRLKEKAVANGAKELVNFRMQSADVGYNKQNSGSIEIFCYATAIK